MPLAVDARQEGVRTELDPSRSPAVADLPLFRPEAIVSTPSGYGRAAPLTPPSWRWITLGLVAVILSLAIVLVSANFARKETVPGRLRPSEGEYRVMSSRAGTVSELYVKEGTIVRRGQPLLSISTETTLASGATTNARLMDGIATERGALGDRMTNATAAAELRVTESRLLEQNLRTQVAAMAAQRTNILQRMGLAKDGLDAIRTLQAKGFARLTELKAREDAMLALEHSLLQLDAERADLLGQAEKAAAGTQRELAEARSERNALQEEMGALSQRQVDAELQDRVIIRAVRSGRVTAIRATVGKAVEPNQPAMTILASAESRVAPGQGANLVADLYVPPRAIGFVRPGQRVRLMVDAFPYQQFGIVEGRVAIVAESALAQQELEAVEGNGDDPVYLVTATIPADSVRAYGRRQDLRAGMTLTADIVLEERSLLEWLFSPLLASGRRFL